MVRLQPIILVNLKSRCIGNFDVIIIGVFKVKLSQTKNDLLVHLTLVVQLTPSGANMWLPLQCTILHRIHTI